MTGLEGKNNRFLYANQSKAHNANYQRILGARVSRTLESTFSAVLYTCAFFAAWGKETIFMGVYYEYSLFW